MASASKKMSSVVVVILGCIGAAWLIYYGLSDFIDMLSGFKFSSILSFILSTQLMCLANLMLGVTFFVTIIKDLNYIKKGVCIFSIVVSSIVLVCYVLQIINSNFNFSSPLIWAEISMAIMCIGYIAFFLYKMGTSKLRESAWAAALVGIVALFFVNCAWLNKSVIGVGTFMFELLSLVAHFAVFYCGLKKY